MRKRPLAALNFVLFRAGQFQKMPQCVADDVIVAFVVVAVLFEAADNTGDVRRNGRFFCNDECFHSERQMPLPIKISPSDRYDGRRSLFLA